MFEKLKSAFSSLAQIATHKSLSENELNSILWDFELELIESDVAPEAIESINAKLKEQLSGSRIQRSQATEEFVRDRLKEAIRQTFSNTRQVDFLSLAKEKRNRRKANPEVGPFLVLFLGINGTGKTTTVAKVANLIRKNGMSVVVAAGDTHRAGAIEQLSEHADRLKIKVISQSYGSDPAAVAKDAQLYSQAHNIDVALIDSAGRIQTNKNLMDEMAKISKVVSPDLKVFVGDALAGNDAISQAREFQKATDFDAAILTKADADVKGGAALSIAFVTQRPIIFLGVGQSYDDLMPFNIEKFVESLFDGNVKQVSAA
jgi:fused signal recognition particle receptor